MTSGSDQGRFRHVTCHLTYITSDQVTPVAPPHSTTVNMTWAVPIYYWEAFFLQRSDKENIFFRKWPFSGEDDRGKTGPRALVVTRCDIQSERL